MACRTVMQEEIIRKGPWLEEEDERLATFVTLLGQGRWDFVARVSGLQRTGKSCRLRWMNYLHPDLIHGRISAEEELIILELHERWGNKWSSIARRLPGRTDNEIKNYWRTYLRKKAHAQEQENLQREIDNAMHSTKGYLIKEGDASTQTTSSDHSEHVKEDLCEISEESLNTFGFSNQLFDNSPYETGLSEYWMEGLSNDQTTFKHECSSLDYGNVDSLWDYSSGSLWNTE